MPNLVVSVCHAETGRFGRQLDFWAVVYTDTTSIGIDFAETSSVGVQYTDTDSIGVTETICANFGLSMFIERRSRRRVFLRVIKYRGCRILFLDVKPRVFVPESEVLTPKRGLNSTRAHFL